jgi:diaminopimelate decarboxylase
LIAGRDAEGLARANGTPVFVLDLVRVEEQAVALRHALADAGLTGVVRLALKAGRHPALMAFLRRRTPWIGLDVCSPGEVRWGLEHGWAPKEISYTGTNVSARDLDQILEAGVHLNVDLLTQLERVGRRAPGTALGVRVNPRIGASATGGEETLYTGSKPTKFGVFAEQLERAVAIASDHHLSIDTVHFHVGDGYLNEGLGVFEESVRRVAGMVRTLKSLGCQIAEVNTGGGLGVPQRAGDRPLDVDRWAAILAEHLGPLDVVVGTEPGDFLLKESSALLIDVVTVEDRDGVRFVGVDAGWNLVCERFVYHDDPAIVLCRAADAEPRQGITVSGNINEGPDVFAEDLPFPDVHEDDVLAIVNIGSYDQAMYSEHCLRPPAGTVAFADRI